MAADKETVGIGLDWEVFAREGETAVGAVRRVERNHVIVYFENAGDRRIEPRHIASVHDDKVILELDQLPEDLLRAIAHAHDDEVNVANLKEA